VKSLHSLVYRVLVCYQFPGYGIKGDGPIFFAAVAAHI